MGLIGWIIKVIKEIWSDTAGSVLPKILGKGAETERGQSFREFLAALDPFKLGSPLTKGEAHFINDAVVYHLYGQHGEGGVGREHRGPVTLAMEYEHLKHEFGILRHGWVADYLGDQFCQNSGERLIFMFLTRTGPIGPTLYTTITTFKRSPGSADGLVDKLFATIVWAPLFFFYGSVVFAMIASGILNVFRPTLFWALIISFFAYTRWYGKHGMYLPVMEDETVPSAIIAAVTWAFTLGVALRFFSAPSWFIAERVQIPWFFGTAIDWPNPLFLGLASLIKGLDWGTLLLIWGAAGLGNLYYGENVQGAVKTNKQMDTLMKTVRRIEKKVGK